MKNTKFLRLTWHNWKQTSKEDYMKKWMVMMLALSLFAPAFAGDDSAKGENPSPKQRREMKAGPDQAKREELRKIRKERDEQFKKTSEQVEKLVKEYKKAKPGSKKAEKAKAELAELVGQIRDDQFKFKQEMLNNFQERLNRMENELAEAKKPEAKSAWVEEKTQAVIEDDGDLKVLFHDKLLPPPPPGHKVPGKKAGPKRHAKGPKAARGEDRPFPPHEDEMLLPPPPPEELED